VFKKRNIAYFFPILESKIGENKEKSEEIKKKCREG